MNVSVTGGGGFIGGLLLEALSARGDSVRWLSRRSMNQSVPGCTVGNLVDDSDSLDGFVADCEVVYHCAGELKSPELMYDLHVNGTANLLAAVQRQIARTGRPVHWVQLSSTGAYGALSQRSIIDESFRPSPEGDYEVTKTISDALVEAFAKCEPLFSYTIVRPSIVIGERMPNRSFFQLANMVRRKLFFYIGDRNTNRSTYVHVNDVVRALIACGNDPRARGNTFLLSSDCRQVELIHAMASYAGVPAPRMGMPEGLLRWLLRCVPASIKLPLTLERIDALTKKGGYDTGHIQRVLDFRFERPLPRCIADVLSGEVQAGTNEKSEQA
ncbi:NAD-dependent epimerase/dehydratase family protein [Pseudomonas sp. MH2]|uniref:NAD-dependent epimerase/dehydratase family protein n=1 Tax=Pseudomonas machongensis TaxID=3110229 RepID=A0ABU5V912_9PSED|nr:NAD-dependent epimerase/dehydratase family protein [Pseudomonas sp. MH2]MEA5669844.1 NAD-dependent epimerase/dehydratase family protein [Pseudomonas sp. MH2]